MLIAPSRLWKLALIDAYSIKSSMQIHRKTATTGFVGFLNELSK